MTGSFEAQLRAFEHKTIEKMGRAARKIILDAFSGVIMMTPVDSGRARGSWQSAIGSVPSGTVEALDPDGNTVIATVAGVVDGMQPGDVIYMTSNLPYMPRLEEGYSQQAPAGMVRLVVQRYQAIADAVIRQIGAE